MFGGSLWHLETARQKQPWKYMNFPESTAGTLPFPAVLLEVGLLAMSGCTLSGQCLLPFTAPWEVISSPAQLRMNSIAIAALTAYCFQLDCT